MFASFGSVAPVAAAERTGGRLAVATGLPADARARIDRLIEAGITAGDFPGAVAVVASSRRILYRQAYGARTFEPRTVRNDPSTIYEFASVTKPAITATAIASTVAARMRYAASGADPLAAARTQDAGVDVAAETVNWLQRGNDAVRRGQLREALADFTRATIQLPLDPAPWYDRALTYSRLGLNAEALADAEHAVSVQAFFDEGFALIARLKQEMGKFGEALASIDRALALNPRRQDYHVRRAELLRLLERMPEASAEYADVLRREPNSVKALRGRAEILLAQHQDREALQVLQQYAGLAPDDSDVNVAAAGLLVAAGRSRDALTWIGAHPSLDSRMIDFKVQALMQLGSRSAAMAALPPSSAGDSAYRASLRGQLAFDAGRCREAAEAYRAAAAAPDATALTWRNFGSASACAQDYGGAVAELTRAIDLNPADALARRYRASVHRALGNRRAAIEDAGEALRLGGPDADLLMMLGVDEYRAGSREQGRRDYARGCSLLDPQQTEKRKLCAEQLPKLR
jgi:tetratricopeptide (TPR) repeat protein